MLPFWLMASLPLVPLTDKLVAPAPVRLMAVKPRKLILPSTLSVMNARRRIGTIVHGSDRGRAPAPVAREVRKSPDVGWPPSMVNAPPVAFTFTVMASSPKLALTTEGFNVRRGDRDGLQGSYLSSVEQSHRERPRLISLATVPLTVTRSLSPASPSGADCTTLPVFVVFTTGAEG